MICHDARLLIPFRRTGDLLPEDVALLDAHLASCPGCTALAAPHAADAAIRSVLRSVEVPASLHRSLAASMTAERNRAWRRGTAKVVGLGVVLAGLIAAGWGIRTATRPRLDGEGLAIRNGFEADRAQLPNLIYEWLIDERLPTDLPFEIDFTRYAAHGHEKFGRAYVPFLKLQSANPTVAFAKIYFARVGEVDAKAIVDGTQSSFCTVRTVPGPKGLTYILVHTGNSPAPFVRPMANDVN
jgi:hypothetical protein